MLLFYTTTEVYTKFGIVPAFDRSVTLGSVRRTFPNSTAYAVSNTWQGSFFALWAKIPSRAHRGCVKLAALAYHKASASLKQVGFIWLLF